MEPHLVIPAHYLLVNEARKSGDLRPLVDLMAEAIDKLKELRENYERISSEPEASDPDQKPATASTP